MSFLQIPIGTYPNTFLGYESSISMITGVATGIRNSAFGNKTLRLNTTGVDNSAFGNEALSINSTGNWNSAFGNYALRVNQTGVSNSAFGDRALTGNLGSYNSSFGSDSAGSLSFTGSDNCSFGYRSLWRLETGSKNSIFGVEALSFAFGAESENSAFGWRSLYSLNGGNRNSAFGYQSGSAITTGSKNSILGSYSGNQGGLDIRTLSNYIVLSDGDGNPRLWIDNTGAVNIPGGFVLPGGTANGVLYLNGSKVVTSGSGLTFDGANFKVTVPTGTPNTDGFSIKLQDVGGSANDVGFGVDGSGNLWQNVAASGPGFISYIGGSEQMRLTSTGLGIGTSSPTQKLQVSGGNILVSSASEITIITNGANFTTGAVTDSAITKVSGASLLFGTGSTEQMRLDASGNLGLGVTPSAWGTSAFQTKVASVWGFSNNAYVGCNYYFDGTNRRYIATAAASEYAQFNGQHTWYTAPSGTAGNAISFTQAMTLDASGRLGVGTTSPSNTGVTAESTGSNSVYFTANNTTGYNFIAGVATAAGYGLLGMTTNHALAFLTNNSERARIPAAGGMVVGTAALATTATDGFLYVPTCAGTPTGTPTTQTGTAPIVVDTTNNKLYFYSGGQWRDAGP